MGTLIKKARDTKPNCKMHAERGEFFKIPAEDTEDSKVIPDARLKFGKDIAPPMSCIQKNVRLKQQGLVLWKQAQDNPMKIAKKKHEHMDHFSDRRCPSNFHYGMDRVREKLHTVRTWVPQRELIDGKLLSGR